MSNEFGSNINGILIPLSLFVNINVDGCEITRSGSKVTFSYKYVSYNF